MQTTGEGCVGSGGFGTGHDGMDKLRRSWHEQRAVWTTETRDVRAAEAATPKHWASIERRRKRQTAHRDKDNGRSSKRTRRALEALVADRNVGARVDAREQPDYGLRGRDDTDEYYAEHEHDTIWGDTVVASRREPCASPPAKKLDFEAVALRLPASPSLEPATPAPVSVLKAPETPEPPPVVRGPAFGARVGHAALPTQKLDFEAIELEAAAANPPAVPQEQLAAVRIQACRRGAIDRNTPVAFQVRMRQWLRKYDLSRLEDEMQVAEEFTKLGVSWDPVWVVVYLEGQALYKGTKMVTSSVLGVADEQLFSYCHATLRDVFEYMIEDRGMGAAATHVLRSTAGRELLDLDQTLHEANKQRCIERVREQRGLFLELCRWSDAVESLESPSEPPVAPSVPASVSALHRPCPARGSTLTPPQRQCATRGLPTQKLDFEAIELEAAAATPVEPSVPASVSVPHCPWIPHRRR